MSKPKILALYLPQFHSIKENDEWWGKGFTEWNAVKSATKISRYVDQPKKPLNGYYDLSKKEDIEFQVKLAKTYKVDGFLIYMYYSNGQVLLEKPAQILLNNSNLDIDFCFSWANHDWKKTWYECNTELLRKQEYGDTKEQIKKHFEYMLPYFKDKRYIKKDNSPVLYIYDYQDIKNFDLYVKIWDKLAKENGFNGMFYVQTLGGKCIKWNKDIFPACFDFEPTYTTFLNPYSRTIESWGRKIIKKVFRIERLLANIYDYNHICSLIIKRNEKDRGHYLGVFAEWDNTPRHKYNGIVFKNFNIQTFYECFESQYKKSLEYNKDFIIIDAWNEWGEGAFLEPDETYGYQKLEVIRKVVEKYW